MTFRLFGICRKIVPCCNSNSNNSNSGSSRRSRNSDRLLCGRDAEMRKKMMLSPRLVKLRLRLFKHSQFTDELSCAFSTLLGKERPSSWRNASYTSDSHSLIIVIFIAIDLGICHHILSHILSCLQDMFCDCAGQIVQPFII